MSLTFEWKDEYNLDGGAIDEDHKHLFELANRVLEISQTHVNFEQVKATVKELYVYMSEHFGREQKLMKATGFPQYEQHILEHRAITRKMNRLLRASTAPDVLLSGLRHIMLDWVLQHILHDDQRFADFRHRQMPALRY
jgi:hemerythrin